MLEPLGLLVHVVPRDADDVGQEPLDQPVAADDRLRLLEPVVGEPQRLVLRARDVAVLLEAADHLVHGRRREPHRAGDVRARDRQLRLHQPVDDLEVLLLGRSRMACSLSWRSERTTSAGRAGLCCAPCGSAATPARSSRAPHAGSGARMARGAARAAAATVGLISRSAPELRGHGSRAIPLPADVGDRGQVEAAVTRFVEEAGRHSTCWSRTPGVAYYGPFRDAPIEEAEEMTRVNWLGTIYTVHAALPHMLDRATRAHRDRLLRGRPPHVPLGGRVRSDQVRAARFLEALRHELSGTGVERHAASIRARSRRTCTTRLARRAACPTGAGRTPGSATERVARRSSSGDRAAAAPRSTCPPTRACSGSLHGLSPALADRDAAGRSSAATAAPAGRSR